MKQSAKKITAAVLCGCLVFLCACTGGTKSMFRDVYSQYDNLAAESKTFDRELKELSSFKIIDDESRSNSVTVDLQETKSFNTITLGEKDKNVTLFSIYASNTLDKDYVFLYQGDTIEKSRGCFVGDVSYRYLRIFITEASDKFKVTDIGVYNVKNEKAEDLRVNAYLVAPSMTEKTDFSMLDSVTDIIFFGMAKFNSKGDIEFFDNEDKQVDATVYEQKLQILRNAIGDRDINVTVDIHVPYGDNNKDINTMMSENLDNTVNNIKNFVEKYQFDGYDIDYEYPRNNKEWKLFNDFLRAVNKVLPDKILSIATAPWALKFDKDVIEMIDRVELMLYDGFDSHGYQATFPYAVEGVEKLLSRGFKKEQIDLGVPFYSRPINGHEYWGGYADFVDQIGKYNNLVPYNGFDHSNLPMTAPQYFNSYQMIADKTAFAVDANIGGMMIWHMTCDTPYNHQYSLFRAIQETKDAKQLTDDSASQE